MAVCEGKKQDTRIQRIASSIRVVPDFPKKANGYRITGIMFQDITTLLLDPKAFKDTVDLFVEQYTGRGISVVAGKSPELPHLQWLRDVKSSSPL
ncbi:adenine phosphoribosyltransferase [Musa troglodytarum]|uniref:adenine phosphoribosyltransferase n=1 Tax=Musa troglodytarum TaxID=320322 RepID=A0A9E7GY34_9LILI|nr:adenine phosphoribosyltransferase [Musa troglodytarum]